MDKSILEMIVASAGPGLTLFLMGLLMGMRKRRAAVVNDRRLLAYGIGAQLSALLSLFYCMALAILPFISLYRYPDQFSGNLVRFLGITFLTWALACLCGWLPKEIFLNPICYDNDGIYTWSWRNGHRFTPWTDIVRYRDNGFNLPFLESLHGPKIKIWNLRDGFPEFLEFIASRRIPGAGDAKQR